VKKTLALLLLLAPGCISYCRFDPELVKAEHGNRSAIAEAGELGRPRVPSTAERLPSLLEAYGAIMPNLSSTNAATRLVAAEAVRHLSERAPDVYRNHYPGLFEALLADPAPEVRWQAAWAKARLFESSPALRAAASDPDDLVAEEACFALGAAHDDQAFEPLLLALDRSPSVSRAAFFALTRISGRELPDAAAWRTYVRQRENARAATAPVGS
jgi:hypothetical protein